MHGMPPWATIRTASACRQQGYVIRYADAEQLSTNNAIKLQSISTGLKVRFNHFYQYFNNDKKQSTESAEDPLLKTCISEANLLTSLMHNKYYYQLVIFIMENFPRRLP